MFNIIAILGSVTLNALAQVFLKLGMGTAELPVQWTAGEAFRMVLWATLNPWIVAGVASYVLSLLVWLYVLAYNEVSYAYPFLSVGFVLVTMLGWWVFDDSLSFQRILGISLICLGVVLVSRT